MNNVEDEYKKVANIIRSLPEKAKIAILFRQRNKFAIKKLLNMLQCNEIYYFYALFSDEDKDYIDFHIGAKEILKKEIPYITEKKS